MKIVNRPHSEVTRSIKALRETKEEETPRWAIKEIPIKINIKVINGY